MQVADIDHETVDERSKGIPAGAGTIALGEIGAKGWNILREDLTLPIAVLKESALTGNGAWMREFLALSGSVLAPHGKTTMAPQLFRRQLEDGAWGITIGTIQQLQVARRYGFQRLILANQLVGRQAVRYVLEELRRDPDFDFYCLVDSMENVEALASAAAAAGVGRPLQVLLEGGLRGARTGCRDLETALAVARAVKAAEPHLTLVGVEGFEGLATGASTEERARVVSAFLDFLVDIAVAAENEKLFYDGTLILTAGGSAFYDLVAERFPRAGLTRPVRVVVRSGCYLTHDSKSYAVEFFKLRERSPAAAGIRGGLRPALEVWAYVQSVPEPGRVILNMGQRDAGRDAGWPVPLFWYRPGAQNAPRELGPGYEIVNMNDQHAWVDVPADHPLKVGDMVGSGVSHPCTTFDKWQFMAVVNDGYDVTGGVRTYF